MPQLQEAPLYFSTDHDVDNYLQGKETANNNIRSTQVASEEQLMSVVTSVSARMMALGYTCPKLDNVWEWRGDKDVSHGMVLRSKQTVYTACHHTSKVVSVQYRIWHVPHSSLELAIGCSIVSAH